MTGVTPHGIRYPDGASKAKNLGPELQTMAEDIDTFIDEQIDAQNPLFAQMAEEAVDEELSTRDLVEGGDPRLLAEGQPDRWRVLDQAGRTALEVKPSGAIGAAGADIRPGKTPGWRIRDLRGRTALEVLPDGTTRIASLEGGASSTTRVVLVIVLGQSNAEGRGQPIHPRIDRPHSRLMMASWVGSEVVAIEEATVPLSSQQQQIGLSIGTVIGRAFVNETDDRTSVVVLNAAAGGSGLVADPTQGNWSVDYAGTNPALTSIALDATTRTLDLISAKFGDAVIEPWIFWHQGEADASTTSQADYATALDAVISTFRAHLGDTSTPFTAGGMVPEWLTDPMAGPRLALIETPARVQFTAYTDGVPNGGGSQNTGDRIHYGREGVLELGAAMWAASQRAATATADQVPHKPLTVTAHRAGGDVYVAWSEPLTRWTGFVVQYRIDGGSWQTAPRPVPMQTTEKIAGLSGALIEVRVRTTNEALTSEATIPVPAIGT